MVVVIRWQILRRISETEDLLQLKFSLKELIAVEQWHRR